MIQSIIIAKKHILLFEFDLIALKMETVNKKSTKSTKSMDTLISVFSALSFRFTYFGMRHKCFYFFFKFQLKKNSTIFKFVHVIKCMGYIW